MRMQAAYEVLNVLDFTSERGRMSIIVRAPDGTLRLHCKGSDAALLARLRPDMDAGVMDQTHTNLHDFSVKACSPLPTFQSLMASASIWTPPWHGLSHPNRLRSTTA